MLTTMETLLFVYDVCLVDERDVIRLQGALSTRGFDPLMIGIDALANPEFALRVFNIADLPPADLEEIRAMVAEKVK